MNTKKNKLSKSALTRIIGVIISVVGFCGIFAVKALLDHKFEVFVKKNSFVPISHDNFYLFFDISTLICAVLLTLTLVSAATYVFQKEKPSKFTFLTVTVSPILCGAAILMVSCFYAYLTHGAEFTMWYWILCLGVFETMLFALPFAITKAHKTALTSTEKQPSVKNGKNKERPRPGNK